jgi:hypothetical protein
VHKVELPVVTPYPCLSAIYYKQHKGALHFIDLLLHNRGEGMLWFLTKLLPQVIMGICMIIIVDLTNIRSLQWYESWKTDIQKVRAPENHPHARTRTYQHEGRVMWCPHLH